MAGDSGYCLLTEPWLPIRRRSGARTWVAPHGIVDGLATDPVVAPDWGRADFDAATLEFLIGLLATACPPPDLEAWADLFRSPPSPDDLAAAFAPLAHAFRLGGPGPRFLQDLEDFAAEPSPVSGLFIEAPGANTEKNNADLFQKRGRLTVLGRPAAAMALFTLQAYAPSGGAGHRTSLRGGGPLTTLVVPPQPYDSLWHRLWLNVPDSGERVPEDLQRVFAWLAPTRTSEGKAPPIGADDVHPLAVFWGMPRRIRLDVEALAEPVPCSVTGEPVEMAAVAYRTRPWGMNYLPITHPLSPMYRPKKTSPDWLYVHPQPDGLTYRHWIGIACANGGEAAGLRRPAAIVEVARQRLRALRLGDGRLWAAGYDMDNMKARGFVEATFPLFSLPDGHAAQRLDAVARALVDAAADVASLTARAVGAALQVDGLDNSRLSAVREAFFAETQAAFFTALNQLAGRLADAPEAGEVLATVGHPFLNETLRPTAFAAFDREAPMVAPGAREAERIIRARFSLAMALRGFGKSGQALFAHLALPLPETKAARKSKSHDAPVQ